MSADRQLWRLSQRISTLIGLWLKEHEGKTLYVQFKPADMLRLTRLQVWSWRHKVSVDEILTLTLPYLRKSLRNEQKKRYGLGCSIAALTGAGNEKILIEAIRQKYPGGEHRDIWRQSERQRQLDAEAGEESDGTAVRARPASSLFDADSIAAYIKSYRARIAVKRRQAEVQPWRRRKRYAGNPWL